mmetsp:Transcript_5330/g.6096  ORF Transcript_5330/g.6096 Transcript_5330/m.6096 type:complete len:106 (-) Transcript_5330:148-465(-)
MLWWGGGGVRKYDIALLSPGGKAKDFCLSSTSGQVPFLFPAEMYRWFIVNYPFDDRPFLIFLCRGPSLSIVTNCDGKGDQTSIMLLGVEMDTNVADDKTEQSISQ